MNLFSHDRAAVKETISTNLKWFFMFNAFLMFNKSVIQIVVANSVVYIFIITKFIIKRIQRYQRENSG